MLLKPSIPQYAPDVQNTWNSCSRGLDNRPLAVNAQCSQKGKIPPARTNVKKSIMRAWNGQCSDPVLNAAQLIAADPMASRDLVESDPQAL